MLPVMLDISASPTLLIGSGQAALRRLVLLEEAGAKDIRVYMPDSAMSELRTAAGTRGRPGLPANDEIAAARVLFVADSDEAETLAATARRLGVLVNVEDHKALCDFYTPSVVRRGDLAIAISTHGASPGLARRIRQKIAEAFGPEWGDRLRRVAACRGKWRKEGCDMQAIARRTDDLIERNGWL